MEGSPLLLLRLVKLNFELSKTSNDFHMTEGLGFPLKLVNLGFKNLNSIVKMNSRL